MSGKKRIFAPRIKGNNNNKYYKMKKVISSLLVVVMALSLNTAKADNISKEEAQAAAAYFMGYYTGQTKITADNLELVYQIDNQKLGIPASYFFNLNDEGWIIMAGTTTIDPIIGYSTEGSLDPECFPENMRWWVNGYSDMVSEIQELDALNDYPDDPVWTALKTQSYKGDTKDAQHILMNEKWGQGNTTNPTYNMYCPQTITSGRYAVTGCVATALSQIIHYYRYPKKGSGLAKYWLRTILNRYREDSVNTMPNVQLKYNFDDSAIFNYSMMPDFPVTKYGVQTCSDEEMKEVARLCYAAGVSVNMGYLPDGSSALSTDVPTAAYNNFGYKRGSLVYRNGNNDRTFVNGIREMLLQNNIVYMGGASSTGSGRDASGHAWVCGGYKETDTNSYYMNWGWHSNSNGFYNLGKNSMYISSQGLNFTERQEYIKGLVPPDDSNRYLGIVELDREAQLGTPYPNPAVSVINLPYNTNEATELTIFNIQGRPVATYRVQAGKGDLMVRVDAMPTGVYIYRMNNQTGKFLVK